MVFNLFHVKDPPKITCNLTTGPSSQNVLFQGQPPRNKDLSEKPIHAVNTYSNMCTRFLDFSKIADLQARSAAPSAAL